MPHSGIERVESGNIASSIESEKYYPEPLSLEHCRKNEISFYESEKEAVLLV